MMECVLKFDSIDEAVNFAKKHNPESTVYKEMFEIAPNDAWLFVIGICDICKARSVFFIPASNDNLYGCECFDCGNKSVYPKEGNFNDA